MYPQHFFSRFNWETVSSGYRKMMRIRYGDYFKAKQYKGDKGHTARAREANNLMDSVISFMTDMMIEDMIENGNRLRVTALDRTNRPRYTAELGVYDTGTRPVLKMKVIHTKHNRSSTYPVISIKKETANLFNKKYYRGKKYGNVHIQRGLTKNR